MALFLVGSRPGDEITTVYDSFVAQAKDFGTQVGVLIAAEPDEAAANTYLDPIRARWPQAQFKVCWLNQDTPLPAFDDLGGLIVADGKPADYLKQMRAHREAIARQVRAGMPYLGFAAGAMITAKNAIIGGVNSNGRQVCSTAVSEGLDAVTVEDGLALIGPSVDTHADTCQTLGRGVEVLRNGEMGSVLLIDEATALIVNATNGRTQTVGHGCITWLSRAGAHIAVRFESPKPTPNVAS